jgi:hypothetical protein
VWSQTNTDFYGRDEAELLVELPWRGWTNALVRARIPYLPVHIDHLERDAAAYGLALLILPNLAAMTGAEAASVRRFAERGGGLIATGDSSLCNEWGEPREDFALADVIGAHTTERRAATNDAQRLRWARDTQHTYLRLTPELRARVDGEKADSEPRVTAPRHPILRGFEETDILPFGGVLEPRRVDADATVLATFIPAFPIYPPETAWMREPRTGIPGLIVRVLPNGGRIAFLPADLDRRFARDNLPDHGNLLANLIRWAARDDLPLAVEGPGLIDCHLYRQPGRLILHLVNLTSAGTWRQPVHEIIRVGPLQIKLRLPEDIRSKKLRLLVAGKRPSSSTKSGWASFEIKSVHDHEVVVIGA